MKRLKTLASLILFFIFLKSTAAANGLNLNSLGSRASAMGGAFMALADDFGAVFWNPAGAAQFSTRYFGLCGADLIPRGSYRLDLYLPVRGDVTIINAKTQSQHYFAGLAAYYHPLSDNLVFGLGIYTPSNFGVSWNGVDLAPIADSNASIDWMSKIKMTTISPAIAYKVSHSILIGASINMNYGTFDLGRHAGTFNVALPAPPYILPIDLGQYKESMSGWGYGATLGILIKPDDSFSLGAAFRTACTIRYKGDARIDRFPDLGVALSRELKQTSGTQMEMTWPLWLGGGVAYKPNKNLTLAADIQWTQWSKIDVITTTYKDPRWESYMSERGNDRMPMSWENTLQIRFGAEYRMNVFAVRAGFYIDPSPAPDETPNVLISSSDFDVVTFGLGYHFKKLSIDFGLEYLMPKERKNSLGRNPVYPPAPSSIWDYAIPGEYNVKMLVPSLSLGYRF